MTDQEIIDNGSQSFKDIDAGLQTAYEAATALIPVIEAAVAAGWVGALQGKKMINHTRAIAGHISEVGDRAADLHIKCSKIADEKGLPTQPLTSVAGVVVPMGGTR